TAIFMADGKTISEPVLMEAYKESTIAYDRAGDRHYDTISAFIKSMRGSDPDAAVYYMAKMLVAGEDPVFIARRMVIFASEDVGNAAVNAITMAMTTFNAVKNIGMPEAEIILSQCATFLAAAPKSNASYLAIKKAKQVAADTAYEIPLHIRNAPTGLMKNMGYGKGYKYPHDFEGHFVDEQYLPDELRSTVFYRPGDEGGDRAIRDRLHRLWPWKYNNKENT
ncbi:MAG TPA: replication-associated recombination protein A, partial [Spirochaetota bacterium]|nr:replication-associated recombination protein A [Spirochaetota bacterium]